MMVSGKDCARSLGARSGQREFLLVWEKNGGGKSKCDPKRLTKPLKL